MCGLRELTQWLHESVLQRRDADATYRPANVGEYLQRTRLDYNDTPFVHAVTVFQSQAYIAGTSTTLAMPDLTGATGFLTSWEPGPSASTAWGVVAQTVNDGPPVCVDGGISRLASAGGGRTELTQDRRVLDRGLIRA